MKKILCTLIASVITAALSAVSAFAADGLLFIGTEPAPKGADEYAADQWENNCDSPGDLVFLGLTKKEAKSAELGKGIIVTHLSEADTKMVYYPILSGGRIVMFMIVPQDSETGEYSVQMGKQDIEEKLNAVKTSPADPARLYDDYGFYFAAAKDEVTVLYNLFDADASKQISEIKKLHGTKNKNEVINVYGSYKAGWQEIDGEKYYIKKDGTLAAKNTVINGKRYKFSSDGKCLGTFTGFSKQNGVKYYYKKGVIQTGWITSKNKKYYAAKSGEIRTGWAAIEGSIYYFDKNGVWDGKTYKSWNHVYKPKTVRDFLLDFDYPDEMQYEINFNEGKYNAFDNIELIREILSGELDTEFVFDDTPSDDEVQEGLPYPSRNAIMLRSDPKKDTGRTIPHLKFSKDSKGNTYLYVPFYNFGCILKDGSAYDKILAEIPQKIQKDKIADETETN